MQPHKVRRQIHGWVYIGVAEQQKRGAWHWHLAVTGRQNVTLLRQLWLKVVGEGNIDVNPPKGSGKYRLLALVKYLSKYLAKGFDSGSRELNKRRFRACHGIEVPVSDLTVPDIGEIRVTGNEAVVTGNSLALAMAVAETKKGTSVEVPKSVFGWLPDLGSNQGPTD